MILLRSRHLKVAIKDRKLTNLSKSQSHKVDVIKHPQVVMWARQLAHQLNSNSSRGDVFHFIWTYQRQNLLSNFTPAKPAAGDN